MITMQLAPLVSLSLTICLLLSGTGFAQTIESNDSATTGHHVADSDSNQVAEDRLTPRHGRLAWLADPATQVTALWNTHAEGQQHRVSIREQGSEDCRVILANSAKAAFLKPHHRPFFHHQVTIDGLQPGSRYELQFESDGRQSRWFYFDTARSDNQPFSLLFGGDSRTGLQARKQVNRRIANMVADSWESAEPADHILALAHGGDYVFNGTDAAQWHQWLEDHELTVGVDGRMLPVIPARGNHDRGQLFAQAFGFEPSDENYYGLSYGTFLRVVTLNTETSIAGDQTDWLAEELASSRPRYRWLIVQYHRPAYPAVKSPSGALAHWVPLFEKFNVDLVCEADGHNIKRTVPIRGGTMDRTGVVYIGEGGMGVPQRKPKTNRWFLRPPGFAASGHHMHVLRFTDDALRVECTALDGETLDVLTRTPRDTTAEAAKQRQPAG
jgi:hypothetical protein